MFKKIMIAASALLMATPVVAAQPTRVLYMEVDEGPKLMERNTQAFQRIFDHTGNFLSHEHIRLFEEVERSRVGERSFDEAMDIAASTKRKKLDAVVMISVKHDQDAHGLKVKDRMVAIARIVDARSLRVVDTLRVKSPIATLRKKRCTSECLDLIKRRHVREILPEFKEKLADRLRDYRPQKVDFSDQRPNVKPSSKLTLTLKGFTPREVRHLEDRIARLESTRDFSSLRSNPGKPAFWLERRENAGNVRDDLGTVLANLDLSARIIQTERQITLVKVNNDLAYLH